MIVLNVGGGSNIAIPDHFNGWTCRVLDINQDVNPDVLCDAKDMRKLAPSEYDCVYSSHTLEHFYRHEVAQVLAGFDHVLKPDGFVQIAVPDIGALLEAARGKDIHDSWYIASKPISFHDVLYGWNWAMSRGNLFYAHKCGFTERSLTRVMSEQFSRVFVASDGMNLHAYGFKKNPSAAQKRMLGL